MAKVEIGAGMETKKQLEAKWEGIRGLTEAVLNDFQVLGAKQVNWRLNESHNEDKRPVFMDWLALPRVSDRLAKRRTADGDLGKSRLGETTPSEVYDAGLDRAGKGLIERNWKFKQLLKEKRVESKLLVPKAGLMYQRFIGIIAEEEGGRRRRAGLLTVSFEKKPKKQKLDEVDKRMKEWASWPGNPKSKLVTFIEDHFQLGGPFIK